MQCLWATHSGTNRRIRVFGKSFHNLNIFAIVINFLQWMIESVSWKIDEFLSLVYSLNN